MKAARSTTSAALVRARRPSRTAIVAGLFVIAFGLRGLNAWRPVDGSIWNPALEADAAAIARNFYREGMNLFYPRIDWRGAGEGFVESELPLQPFLAATLYHLLGYHEHFSRMISLAASVLGCYVFWRMADRLLARWPAVIALGFFTFQTLLVASASWIQSESLVLLAYLLAIDQFDRWMNTGGWRSFVTTWLATSLAILLRLSSAHVILLFALMAVRRFGRQATRRIDLWMLAALSVAPAVLWYAHARSLWLEYGNSLGLSNDAFVGYFSLSNLRGLPTVVMGLFAIEAAAVWTPPGLVFAVPAVRGLFLRGKGEPLVTDWTLALVAFYFLTSPITGEPWAYYLHIVSVPLVALAVGISSEVLFRSVASRPPDLVAPRGAMHQTWLAIALTASAYALVGWALHYLVGRSWRLLASISFVALLGGAAVIYLDRWSQGRSPTARSRRLRLWLVGLLIGASLTAGWNVAETRRYFHGRPEVFAKYEAALQFDPQLREPGPIAVAAPGRRDAYGRPLAGSGSYFFYWLDRKGFTVSTNRLSVETLQELASRGVRYFIAERGAWDRAPVLEGIVRRRFRVVDDHATATLFELTPQETLRELE